MYELYFMKISHPMFYIHILIFHEFLNGFKYNFNIFYAQHHLLFFSLHRLVSETLKCENSVKKKQARKLFSITSELSNNILTKLSVSNFMKVYVIN